MNAYEKLLTTADADNITVFEKYDLSDTRLKGLYCDGAIALDGSMTSCSDRTCVLAEELGHHYTSSGIILDQSVTQNRKQELLARSWAYNKLVGLTGIVSCYRSGCINLYEMAEHLNVTEDFLKEALLHYKSKYGASATLDNYVIYFEPTLGVFELR